MKRIFHPIGQGAFYTEHFDVPVTMVYDCGSLTLNGKSLRTKVHSSLYEKQDIDILFISHFHADHINGITYIKDWCKIKNVVIPYLDDEAKALMKIANFAVGYTETQLIDDPETFFGGNTRIIRVRPVGENGLDNFNPERPFPVDPEEGDAIIPSNRRSGTQGPSVEIDSGTPLTTKQIPEWFFIPYNFNQTERVELFKAALTKEGLEFKDVDTIEKIQLHKKKIQSAYEVVTGDLNKNSMFLYSGPLSNAKEMLYFVTGFPLYRYFLPDFFELPLGCLYMGDADLNEKGLVTTLLLSLSRVVKCIGTAVVAHHGAIKNHNNLLYSGLPGNICCVICYGTTNTYGHPSDYVIAELIPFRNISMVTEKQESISIFMQRP